MLPNSPGSVFLSTELPASPVAESALQHRECRMNPWSGAKAPHAAGKAIMLQLGPNAAKF